MKTKSIVSILISLLLSTHAIAQPSTVPNDRIKTESLIELISGEYVPVSNDPETPCSGILNRDGEVMPLFLIEKEKFPSSYVTPNSLNLVFRGLEKSGQWSSPLIYATFSSINEPPKRVFHLMYPTYNYGTTITELEDGAIELQAFENFWNPIQGSMRVSSTLTLHSDGRLLFLYLFESWNVFGLQYQQTPNGRCSFKKITTYGIHDQTDLYQQLSGLAKHRCSV